MPAWTHTGVMSGAAADTHGGGRCAGVCCRPSGPGGDGRSRPRRVPPYCVAARGQGIARACRGIPRDMRKVPAPCRKARGAIHDATGSVDRRLSVVCVPYVAGVRMRRTGLLLRRSGPDRAPTLRYVGAVPLGTCGISAAFHISGPPPTISWTGTAEIPLWPAGPSFGPAHTHDMRRILRIYVVWRKGARSGAATRPLPWQTVACLAFILCRRMCHAICPSGHAVVGEPSAACAAARGIPGPPPGTSGAAHVWADAQKPYICTRTAPLTKTEAEPYGFTEYRDWFIMFIYINPTQHDKWKEKQFMLSCCPLQWWQVE